MAFTESEAKVLGALSVLGSAGTLSVPQLCRVTRLPVTSIHRALLRLSRSGLAMGTTDGWCSTARGRIAMTRPVYREYVGARP